MTVEAALIMPIVLFVLVFVIYSGFAMYDRCVMEEDAVIAVLRGSNLFRSTSEEIADHIQEECIRPEGEEVMMLDDFQGRVRADLLKVEVTMEASVTVPFRGLLDDGGDPFWKIEVKAEAPRYHPGRFLRLIKSVENSRDGK